MKTATDTRPAIRIYKKGEEPNDVAYWLSRPSWERVQALEEIRQQYNNWKYSIRREFQRVYTIVKRKRSSGRLKDKVDVKTLEKKIKKKNN